MSGRDVHVAVRLGLEIPVVKWVADDQAHLMVFTDGEQRHAAAGFGRHETPAVPVGQQDLLPAIAVDVDHQRGGCAATCAGPPAGVQDWQGVTAVGRRRTGPRRRRAATALDQVLPRRLVLPYQQQPLRELRRPGILWSVVDSELDACQELR